MRNEEVTSQLRNRVMNARCRIMSMHQWYGYVISQMRWREDVNCPTAGVKICHDGMIDAVYNPYFLGACTIEQIMVVMMHEVDHVIRLHCVRGISKHPLAWNLAADMIVNGPKNDPRIKDLKILEDLVVNEIPIRPIYYPEDLDKNLTTEELYEKMCIEEIRIICMSNEGQSKGKGKGKGKGSDQNEGSKLSNGPFIDDHSIWDSTISKDVARQIVEEIVENANQAGDAPGHLVEAINDLHNPIISWKDKIKHFSGRIIGSKRKTYHRLNKRHDVFGIKGTSARGSTPVVVLVDTSGSISTDMLKQFFTEIESLSKKSRITLIQFDHEVQSVPTRYRKGDWRKIKVHGRGGTSFENAIDWIKENGFVGKLNIILTDGYAPWPKPESFYILWCIIGNNEESPPWGDVVRIEK